MPEEEGGGAHTVHNPQIVTSPNAKYFEEREIIGSKITFTSPSCGSNKFP